ncbi:hypothetical protein C1646_664500 [Rhizophagus diaphanus]|nr:hypothetical protein C1646_664500 [Rhizophagus diaphanus] [Rhizophagus sp. MUCL 43196]
MTETIQVTTTTIASATPRTKTTSPSFEELEKFYNEHFNNDLQKTYNTLSRKTRFYCNNLGSYKEKVALLEAIHDDRQKHRKKGSAIINLLCIIGVIILILNSLTGDKPDDDFYSENKPVFKKFCGATNKRLTKLIEQEINRNEYINFTLIMI